MPQKVDAMGRMKQKRLTVGMALALMIILTVALLGPRMWPWFFPTRLERARLAYDRYDWQTVTALAREALREKPSDLEALRLLARSQGRMERDEMAQELFSRMDNQAMQAEDLFLLGSGLCRQERTEPAIVVLENARRLDPAHAETLHELARLYARLKRLRDAVEAASQLAVIPGWGCAGASFSGRYVKSSSIRLVLGSARSRLADRPFLARIAGLSVEWSASFLPALCCR